MYLLMYADGFNRIEDVPPDEYLGLYKTLDATKSAIERDMLDNDMDDASYFVITIGKNSVKRYDSIREGITITERKKGK